MNFYNIIAFLHVISKAQSYIVTDSACEQVASQATQTKSNEFTLQELHLLKSQLEQNSFLHIPADQYRSLLIHFGASDEHLQAVETGYIHQQVKQDIEPIMSFRQVAFHRMLLEELADPSSNSTTSSDSTTLMSPANCEAVTQISDDEICSDRGAKVYFKRSGTRKWHMPPKDYSDSSIPRAMARINNFLNPSSHHYQSNLNADSKTTINDQVLIRINKDRPNESQGNKTDIAEPTPEGIHQDGTEFSSVTLIRRHNVKKTEGAESRIWTPNQPTGNYDSPSFGVLTGTAQEGFSWDNCLFNKALESPWETIVFNDRKVKHEARAFIRGEEDGPSYRDVIVNFIRKPTSDGSDERAVLSLDTNTGKAVQKCSSIV